MSLASMSLALAVSIPVSDAGLSQQPAEVESEAAMMPEELTDKVVAWAGEVARCAAQLQSRQAREDYLADRRRELMAAAEAEGARASDAAILADACVSAARRIMTELLAQC